MWPFKSNDKKQRPEYVGDESIQTVPALHEYVEKCFEKYLEVLEAHQTDLTTINTSINRIERKQNRWLELLNVQEASKEASEAVITPKVTADDRLASLLAGEPSEE
ncbi:hypothetical protein ES703_70988 [subsurface metagenome]